MFRTITVTAALFLVSTTAWAADGPAIFKANCAKCHGESGKADTAAGKAMKVPALEAKLGTMSEADIAKQVKTSTKHASVVKALSDDDLAKVAAHIKQLAPK